ncbi:MAG: GIY-YIG nuclease family protein [Fusobacteriaceae bacterium]
MFKIIIYKFENKINGKVYIGQTIQKLHRRVTDHVMKSKRPGKKTVFASALKKYTLEGFDVEVLDTATNIDELNSKEIYWIRKLNSLHPNGYNLSEGGLNKTWHEESRRKLSESKKKSEKQIRVKVFKFNEDGEVLGEFRDTREARRSGVPIPMKAHLEQKVFAVKKDGFIYTTKKELFEKYMEKEKNKSLMDIFHFDKNGKELGVYRTTLEMEKVTGKKNAGVSLIVRGKQKVFEDDSFCLYRKDVNKENIDGRMRYFRHKAPKKIMMYSDNESFIFKNSIKAAEATGLSRQLIAKACKAEIEYKNYNWKYV